MKLIRNLFLYFCIVVISLDCSQIDDSKTKLDIRINYNVNLFHFIDHLSQWSPYTGNEALELYLKNFEITEDDKEKIENYSVARKALGWSEEINLFNWAYKDFILTDSTDSNFVEIKQTIDYFANRKNEIISVSELLENEFKNLKKMEMEILEFSYKTDSVFENIRPFLYLWNKEINYNKFPVYICFSHANNTTHGGANGEGVYTEFIINTKEDLSSGFSTITHELTHKVANISEHLFSVIENDKYYTKAAKQFMEKNKLTKKDIVEMFKSIDTLGYGNTEALVFEEICIHYVAPVLIENIPYNRILKIAEFYESNGEKELSRIWKGVSLFKEYFEQTKLQQNNQNKILWDLIEVFYGEIYFENYMSNASINQ